MYRGAQEKHVRIARSKEKENSLLSDVIPIVVMSRYMDPQEIRSRSQFPRGVRHEVSSLARTLGSWVRIALKDMDVRVSVYSVFVLSCV
jgi:hypothetical protein